MGSILGSLRLLPTDRAHLLNTLFPDLCQAHIPQGAHIREVSQIYLHPELRNQRRRVMLQLASALVQYGLLTGISAYTTVMESIWSDFSRQHRMAYYQLGPDRMVDGISLRASQIHLDNIRCTPCARATVWPNATCNLPTCAIIRTPCRNPWSICPTTRHNGHRATDDQLAPYRRSAPRTPPQR